MPDLPGVADIRCPSRDSNRMPTEYDPRVLLLDQSVWYPYVNLSANVLPVY
jgi:hypothetical protein